MIFKIVSLFLVGMVILGMIGKLKVPGLKQITDAKCRRYGKFTFGKNCDCKGRT